MTNFFRVAILCCLAVFSGPSHAAQIIAIPVADETRVASQEWLVQLPSFEFRFGQPLTLTVEPSDTIDNVLQLLQDQTGLFPSESTVVFASKTLENGRTLSDYNVQNGSILEIRVATGAVPEPATWAMMVIGFGLVGGLIRSARSKKKKVRFVTA